jgi:multisubunit Na+/H+ antiporter MnhB subunit
VKNNFDRKKRIAAVVLLLVAILSVTVIGKYASAPENHQKTIASLDEKKQTVMELTAASTVTSALITLLPGDTATPIAEKMADVSGYLLVVLCAIYLEKYLVTITGYVAFTYLIPIACGLWILNLVFENATVRKLAAKLAVFGIAISLVVPASVKISDLIGDTYQAQIDATIEDAKNTQNILENSDLVNDTSATETETGTTGAVTAHTQEKNNSESGSASNIFDWAKDAISSAKDSVANVVENVTISTEDLVQKVENSLNHFIEAVAVMIITSCVIPMLVLLLFFWMVKIVLDVDLSGVKIKGMLPERKE